MTTAQLIAGVVVLITIGITIWASRQTKTTVQFYAAGRKINAWQNGLAVAGDYMSAASFLGIAGLIAFNGYDGFMYSVGWLVAYLTVLLLVAEPMRNTGRFTMADVLAFRLSPVPVRSSAAVSTMAVSGFYMVAQIVGASAVFKLLVPSVGFSTAAWIIGALMIGYVVVGGMVATTWVQIVKAALLMSGATMLTILVLAHWNFNILALFDSVAALKDKVTGLNFTQPGILYKPGHLAWLGIDFGNNKAVIENVSLGMALIFGTAGLPHILMRFYTVPDAKAARSSVGWAMGWIGAFYVMTTFLGFGAAILVGKAHICFQDAAGACVGNPNSNLAAPLLAKALGGDIFLAFISAVAFATILAVVAGLTLAASSAFAHDFYTSVVRRKHNVNEREQVWVARLTAVVVGVVAVLIAINNPTANAAQMVAAAFAVASSGNFPVILFTLYWRRFNTWGAVAGLLGGTIVAILLVLFGPGLASTAVLHPWFPLSNPGIVSIPLGFLFAIAGTYLGERVAKDRLAGAGYAEMDVRSQTGIGAEPSSEAA
ncbi:MAG: cation acetate symporter [Candidatus Dormiibacterota bacterium]